MSSNGYSGNGCAGNGSGGGAVVIKIVASNNFANSRPVMPDVKLDPPKMVRECRLPECRKEPGAHSEGYCPDHWSNLLSWTQKKSA